MKRRHVLMAVSAGVALGAIAGCAQNPQDAAVVAGHAIRVSDADVLTHALCVERSAEAASVGRSGAAPVSWTKGQAVLSLVREAVDEQFVKAHHLGVRPSDLARQMARYQPLVDHLPKAEQSTAQHLIAGIVKGQMELQTAAVQGLRQAGQQPSQTSVQHAVEAIESHLVKRYQVSINPQYDIPALGSGGGRGGSISTAVSTSARAFGTPGSTSAPVSQLPAGQRCG